MLDRLSRLLKSSVIKIKADNYKEKGFSSKDIVVSIVKEWFILENSLSIEKLRHGVQFVVESANLSADNFQPSLTELHEFYRKIGKLKDN